MFLKEENRKDFKIVEGKRIEKTGGK